MNVKQVIKEKWAKSPQSVMDVGLSLYSPRFRGGSFELCYRFHNKDRLRLYDSWVEERIDNGLFENVTDEELMDKGYLCLKKALSSTRQDNIRNLEDPEYGCFSYECSIEIDGESIPFEATVYPEDF